MTTNANILRSFRAATYRDLAREAVHQGWVLKVMGSSHVIVTNPANGEYVILSQTAHEGGDVVKAKRSEFKRKGLR